MSQITGIEARALELLGNNVSPAHTAAALGVTESAISQMLSREEFAFAVATKRFDRLQRHNETDDTYDSIEKELLRKLQDCLPMMFNPDKILRALSVVNAAKRRGASAPESTHLNQTVVNIMLPQVIARQYIEQNANGQVVSIDGGSLETITAKRLLVNHENGHKGTALSGAQKAVAG